MFEILWILLAAGLNLVGMAWLALAKAAHWEQVTLRPAKEHLSAKRLLRPLGVVACLLSFSACLMGDSLSMALLVWVLLLSVAAVSIALVLTWHPSALRYLLPLAVFNHK